MVAVSKLQTTARVVHNKGDDVTKNVHRERLFGWEGDSSLQVISAYLSTDPDNEL